MVSRVLKRKRIPILGGSLTKQPGWLDPGDEGRYNGKYIEIPVIFEMDLLGSRGQEFRYRFRNDAAAELRTFHLTKVGGARGEFDGDEPVAVSLSKYVNAERPETIAFTGNLESGLAWRTDKRLRNLDPAPKQPDGSNDPRHARVHYVRFYRDNDPDKTWIDVEAIDEIVFLGSRGQEYHYKLRWPTAAQYNEAYGDPFGTIKDDDKDPYKPMIGYCNPSFSLLDVEFDPDDPDIPLPARTDAFQNIVNVKGSRQGIFLAGDGFGKLYASRDGLNWSRTQTEMGEGIGNSPPVYANGQWILGGFAYLSQSLSVGQLWSSIDGFNWTKEAASTDESIIGYGAAYQNVDPPPFQGATIHAPITTVNTWFISEGFPYDDVKLLPNPNPTLPSPAATPGLPEHPSLGFLLLTEVGTTKALPGSPNGVPGYSSFYGYQWGDVDDDYVLTGLIADFSNFNFPGFGPPSLPVGSVFPSQLGLATGGTNVDGKVVYIRRQGQWSENLEATKDYGATWEVVCTVEGNEDPLEDFIWGFLWYTFQEPGVVPEVGATLSCGSMTNPEALEPEGEFLFGDMLGHVIANGGFSFGPPCSYNGGLNAGNPPSGFNATGATFICNYVPNIAEGETTEQDLQDAITSARAAIVSLMMAPVPPNPQPSIAFWGRHISGSPNGGFYRQTDPPDPTVGLPDGIQERALVALDAAVAVFRADPWTKRQNFDPENPDAFSTQYRADA